MPEYIVQWHTPGNDYGDWTREEEFSADDDEEAKRIVVENTRSDRGATKARIAKVVFEGLPSAAGSPLPERAAIGAERQAAIDAEIYLEAKRATLDYKDLSFALRTIPRGSHGEGSAGYHLRILYRAGEGSMGSASKQEVAHAQDIAKLAPGDTTVSAYYLDGPRGPQCVSVSKVMSFAEDEKTPQELIHLWPLEFDNLAIAPQKLKGVQIHDLRK